MRFGLDIDGCFADYTKPFIARLHEKIPAIPANYYNTDYDDWWLDFGVSDEEYEKARDEIREDLSFWEDINVYPEEANVLKHRINKPNEDEFVFVTARPRLKNESIISITKNWLMRNNLFGMDCSVVTVDHHKRKKDIYKGIGVDRALDDRLDTVLLKPDLIWLVIRPWNIERLIAEEPHGVKPIHSISDLERFFDER